MPQCKARTTRRNVLLICLLLLIQLSLVGCNKDTVMVEEPGAPDTSVLLPQQGDIFLTTGYRIKTVITPQTVATFDPLTFEVYIDGQGHGTGLLGYKDKVYDVIIMEDKLHVKVADSVAIQIKDFTGHIIPATVNTVRVADLTTIGFTMLNGNVAGYNYSDSSFIVAGTYQLSDATFDTTTVVAGNIMTMNELINYILSVEGASYVDPNQGGGEQTTAPSDGTSIIPEQGSFWNNSNMGVTIHEKTYSIGDYCNPSTYYEGQLPETMTPRYTYNKDEKVELVDIYYQSTEGRTTFMTTDGYVQTIKTTCDFDWLSIHSGMLQADCEALIGAKLKKADLETFVPMVEGLTLLESKGTTSLLEYGDLRITINYGTNDKREKIVTGITLVRPVIFD